MYHRANNTKGESEKYEDRAKKAQGGGGGDRHGGRVRVPPRAPLLLSLSLSLSLSSSQRAAPRGVIYYLLKRACNFLA